MDLHLRDLMPSRVAAWEAHFDGCDTVRASVGGIFDVTADAIVSPANSFGFMDGGIDLVYVGGSPSHVSGGLPTVGRLVHSVRNG